MSKSALNTLADMPSGTKAVIVKVHGHGGFRHRIMEMGFVRGHEVEVLKNAPLLDPVEYYILGSHISLRRSEAANIEVISLEEAAHPDFLYNGILEEHVAHEAEERSREITVALVGNPNCGKTSFFNYATGLREKVGNYSGVTVDSKIGIMHYGDYTIRLVDLPGTYSLTEYSPEELYVRSFLSEEKPDVVLNIVNAGNLDRNLFLTTQLIDLNPRMVMALNMYDELQQSGDLLDVDCLSKMLGFPIVPTISKTGKGIEEVCQAIVNVYEEHVSTCKHIHINYGEDVERSIREIRVLLDNNQSVRDRYHSRYIALKLLENDSVMTQEMGTLANFEAIKIKSDNCRTMLEKAYNDDIVSLISDLKYGFIRGAVSETLQRNPKDKKSLSYAFDTILTNRWLGFPILFLFLWLMFEATFTLGAHPQEWLEAGVASLGEWIATLLPEGMFADLLVDGVITGVGGVLVFLPNIIILFIFISILEDTGYMARAAFIMDKLMHRIGLHGKSFIPYLIGFGCGVPAIMATRTLENRKDRILTILTIPFMSCSARLPVYLLFVSAFFVRYQSLILMSIYLIGVLIAILTAIAINKCVFVKKDDAFVMELPPYRLPTLRNTVIHMWDKSAMYLKKMGSIILIASVLIWALGYFPRANADEPIEVQTENSYIGRIGHAIEPVVRPLGFDWRMGVSLVTGLAAKEVIVSTLGVLYEGVADEEGASTHLIRSLQQQTDKVGNPFFTPLRAYSYMLFILLYFPCIAAVAAIRREANWRWAAFAVGYTTCIAWLVSFLFYQCGNLF